MDEVTTNGSWFSFNSDGAGKSLRGVFVFMVMAFHIFYFQKPASSLFS